MTTFEDGPAKGQHLTLRRSPKFLRVVEAGGKWDALDQPTDSPAPDERVLAYTLASHQGTVHINRGGGRGGFYPIASYRLAVPQPPESAMRDGVDWGDWVDSVNKMKG